MPCPARHCNSTVDAMNKHCRQQFVRLHSQPLLQTLHAYFQMHYDGLPYIDGRGSEKTQVRGRPWWRRWRRWQLCGNLTRARGASCFSRPCPSRRRRRRASWTSRKSSTRAISSTDPLFPTHAFFPSSVVWYFKENDFAYRIGLFTRPARRGTASCRCCTTTQSARSGGTQPRSPSPAEYPHSPPP